MELLAFHLSGWLPLWGGLVVRLFFLWSNTLCLDGGDSDDPKVVGAGDRKGSAGGWGVRGGEEAWAAETLADFTCA